MKRGASIAVVFLIAAEAAFAARSSRVRLLTDTSSLWWRTCGLDAIAWEWPDGAVSARLQVSGKDGTTEFVFDSSASYFAPSPPTSAGAEDVLAMRLDFFAQAGASGDAMAGESLLSPPLGLVRGVGGAQLEVRPVATNSAAWTKFKSKSLVLPIPMDATSLTLDGDALNATPPWHLWHPIRSGTTHVLGLLADDGFSAALLFRSRAAMVMEVK